MIPEALDDGLRRQHAERKRRIAGGMPRAGWKVCVNDPRVQKRLGLDASFAAFLDGSRVLGSGAAWTIADGSVPGVEPELALRFATRVSADESRERIAAAIEGVAPAIEVVDWRDPRLELEHLAATSSFHAGVVFGDLHPFALAPRIGGDVPTLRRNGERAGVADAALVPADLTALVARLAIELARYGDGFEAGDWLICGACTAPSPVTAGDIVEADFGSIGSVRVQFVR
jgi:2-keto-4-pentenoate hydratase